MHVGVDILILPYDPVNCFQCTLAGHYHGAQQSISSERAFRDARASVAYGTKRTRRGKLAHVRFEGWSGQVGGAWLRPL